jgi:hypothetical protein
VASNNKNIAVLFQKTSANLMKIFLNPPIIYIQKKSTQHKFWDHNFKILESFFYASLIAENSLGMFFNVVGKIDYRNFRCRK